jgi:O-glycosyl hydrolase
MIFDHNRYHFPQNLLISRDRIEAWADGILSDPEASKYVDGVAFHWYTMEQDYAHVGKVSQKYPNKFLLPSGNANNF